MPYFDNDSVSLFYTTHGTINGPPVILIHGWACDAHDWSRQIPLLDSLGFYTVALDLRGHGSSKALSDDVDYSMRAFSDDVAAILQHLRVGPAIVVSHSMGTIIASILSVDHPEVVKGLVLVHPIYSGTPPTFAVVSKAMREDPSAAPHMATSFFEKHMYTPQTPQWLKVWHLRRVMATDGATLGGCAQAIVDLFGSVVGQTEECKAFMRKRAAPRLVTPTPVIPNAASWEEELGLDELDRSIALEEGVFSHFVDSDRFNEILKEWLVHGGFVLQSNE